jgi:diguanylate cyclase (GGDEF)-like protein
LKLRKDIGINIALAVIVATCVMFLCREVEFFKRLELFSLDLSFRIKGHYEYNPNIIIVEISDSDVAAIGQWPWPRALHATMAKTLSDLGAKAIYFDMLFSEPSTEADDKLLEDSVKITKKIYLPFAYQLPSTDLKTAFFPLRRLQPYVKGTGAINIHPDMDGIMRRIPLVFSSDGATEPHIVLKMAMDYMGMELKEAAPDSVILKGPTGDVKIPTDEKHQMLINWPGKWKYTFKHYSFIDILAGYKDLLDGQKTHINPDDFKDSICIIGATAVGLCDIKNIPLEPAYPGLGIMASALDNILDRNFFKIPPKWVETVILYFLAIMPAFFMLGEKPFREMLFLFLISVGYVFVNIVLMKEAKIRLELFTPLFGLGMSSLAIGTYDFIRVVIERKRFFKMSILDGLTELFNIRYFKMNVDTEIMLARADRNKKFSLIMCDIDHFKIFNDTYGHQTGDLVLKSVSNVLKNSVRGLDVVARYGGEEMIILLRGTALSEAINVAEKIRRHVEECIVTDEKNTYKVTISLGVSDYRQGDNTETVIKRADQALYVAKESGRNRVSS